MPITLEQIILKAAEKDRELRCQTASELRSDLKRLEREINSQPVPTVPAAASGDRSARQPLWRWVSAAVAIALLVGLAVWSSRPARTRPSPSVTLRQLPASGLLARTSSLAAYQSVAEANDLYLAGRYRDALERLQNAVKQDDTYADAWALLGKSYARLAQTGTLDSVGARSEFQNQSLGAALRAAEISPTLYEAQVSLALAYRALEQFEPARQTAQRAIDLNPRLAESYELLASAHYASPAYGCGRRRDPEMAERLYSRALELAFGADQSCVGFVAQSPAFAPFRDHPAIQAAIAKYRVP